MNTRTSLPSLVSTIAFLATFSAQASSPFADNPDLYGSVLVNPPQATTDATLERGQGDSYGSVLLDPASKATTDAMVERGMGDTYGSILLDINWNHAHHTRTATL